ncbi:NAGC-like transcriptional regulator [Psychromonas sp. CNPT3]|uniref:ROK family protein n=1 Tax=Psychromonas sp. CNPT3 TaxID=314282 RepID=UPI00006E56B1|nr:ROK family protein [Psychromonas sp. CNPT3]AGH81332.1 NAGC-like transcriptional regulator [Psychromonas sp. CNPT3]
MLYGFDIGGTKIAFCIYDMNLQRIFVDQKPTPSTHYEFMQMICLWVNNADLKYNCKGHIGLGFPGSINQQDGSLYCVNVPAIKGHCLSAELSDALKRDVKLENDANCFLLSECYGGSAEGGQCVLGITLGTGVGGAIFVNGQLHRGLNGFAGELGHYPLPATIVLQYPELPLFDCACGRAMCLETYMSGIGLERLYAHYAKTPLLGIEIIKKYRAGDILTRRIIDIYFDILAAGLATAMLVLDPDVIIIGGGLSNFDELYDALEERLPKHLLKDVALPVICRPTFGGVGGVRGAALLNYQKPQ